MLITAEYISGAVSRSPGAVDVKENGEKKSFPVISAICNSLALMEIDHDGVSRITNTFTAHTNRINCVKWVRNTSKELIITGSSDCTAILWNNDGSENFTFVPFSKLAGHKCGITYVDSFMEGAIYAATSSSDFTLKIWKIKDNGENECIQNIDLGNGLCLAMHFFTLPVTNTPMLACALDDDKVHLYGEKMNNLYELTFSKMQTLIGHEDWVRGIDVIKIDNEKLMIATCSQDTYIRLWSIDKWKDVSSDEIQIERKTFEISDTKWSISLDAVLNGHENWIYSVHWHLTPSNGDLKLLSASIDKTLIVWQPENQTDGIWIEKVRLGEVGGSGLGFYGGKFMNNSNTIIGHGYLGALHIWSYKEESDNWVPNIQAGGHFNEIVDLAWEPEGQFLYTTSTDQTTRIHAPWIRNHDRPETWHEIARPQVHGYDMSCLAVVSRYIFVSGAEEKVIRTFEAPFNFIENLHNICNMPKDESLDAQRIPEGASVPSLGLSNKAVYSNEEQAVNNNDNFSNAQYPDHYFIPTKLREPPTEETLMQNTLWPEQHKLYGHGYEVFALAASQDGRLVASACKATKQQHAAIILWDTKMWLQIQSLESHNLTVTELSFSPDSMCLLSVSRDRRWSIFRKDSVDSKFSLDATTDKTNGIHTRIIWCCAWTHDSKFFSTGSREGKAVLWSKSDPNSDSWRNFKANAPHLTLDDQSITALAFAPILVNDNYLLAVGFELGTIHIYSVDTSTTCIWKLKLQLDNNMAHHLTVRRLSFRPITKSNKENDKLYLASASNDTVTKIFNICYKS